jgi:hypothetical protein
MRSRLVLTRGRRTLTLQAEVSVHTRKLDASFTFTEVET